MAGIDKLVAAILAAAQVSATGKHSAENCVEQYREILALLDMEESAERRAAAQGKDRLKANEAAGKKRRS